MSDTLYVTPAQVLAAQLAIELSEEDGEQPDEALKAIADAQVDTDIPSAAYPQETKAAAASGDRSEAAQDTADLISQLQRLGELKAAGILTDEEFAAAKAQKTRSLPD